MRSLLLLLLAAGLIGLLFFFLLSSDPADALDLSTEPAELPSEVQIADQSVLPSEAERIARLQVEEKQEVGSSAEGLAASGPPWLSGRCLAADTGEALSGVKISLSGWATPGLIEGEDGAPSYESKQDETGEDGRFAIHLQAHPLRQYRMTIIGEDLAQIEQSFAAGALDKAIDFGDIYLQPGASLNGRVIFENGEAIAAQSFELQLDEASGAAPTPAGFEHDLRRYMVTDDKGRFSTQNLPLGSWRIMMSGGLLVASPKRVNTLSVGTQDVVILVEGDDSSGIRGFARTEDGDPVAGVYIHAYAGISSSNSRSQEDGSFRLFGRGKTGEEVTLYLSPNDDTLEPVKQNRVVKWGDKKVELLFRKVLSTGLDLIVVDALSGEPIEDYELRCFPTPYANNREGNKAVRLTGSHEAGRVRIDDLREGSNTLIVLPKDRSYAPGKIVVFDVDQSSAKQLRVELHKNLPILVRVQDAAGNPLAGARVELLRSQGDNPIAEKNENFARPLRSVHDNGKSMSYAQMYNNYFAMDMAWRMAHAETDESGMATLHSTIPAVDHALRASLPNRPPSHLDEVRFGESAGVHVITMFAGAGLELTFQPAEVLSRFTVKGEELGIRLVADEPGITGEPKAQPGEWGTWDLSKTGKLSKEGLIPGNWKLMLQGMHQIDVGTYQTLESEITRIKLVEGETLSLTLNPSGHIPGRIRGHLRIAGKLVRSPRLTVRRSQDPGAEAPQTFYPNQVTVNSAGEFETPPLGPGPYQFQLSIGVSGKNTSFPWTRPIEVAAAQDLIHNLDLAAAALDLLLKDALGQPLSAGSKLRLIGNAKNGARVTGSLEADGHFRQEQVPVGSYRCQVMLKDKWHELTGLQIASGSPNSHERRVNER